MTLAQALATARTEEDVKDAYIAALGLKGVSKNLVDIQTQEVWFEAKAVSTPPIIMFAQLMFYVRAAKKRGEPIPAFLAVIDRDKAAIMPTEKALPLLDDKSIVWPKSGSGAGKELGAQIAPYVQTHIVEYEIAHDEAAFIRAVKDAIKQRRIIRTPITPDNLRQVFDRWVAMIGQELGVKAQADYAVLFFADIMHDGEHEAMHNLPARLLMTADGPIFLLNGETFELANDRGYRNFWAIYHRPPEQKHRHYLLERRDSLLPVDEQKFKGAYYTPLHIVDKAYDQLRATLGENWQNRYLVWDMCAGVGNLEAKHSNLRNVFMSTLDKADVTIMKSNPAFAGAEIFQYDYLNDDVTDFGEIDHSLSNKLPIALRKAIADAKESKTGAKQILVLINPPYAETGSGIGRGNNNKKGVENTRAQRMMERVSAGFASKELFVQFLVRIQQEMPSATLAMFSKLKYVNSPNFEKFRQGWRAKFIGGYVVPSRVFDKLKGNFPIGFLVWDQSQKENITETPVAVLNRAGAVIGEKIYRTAPTNQLLNVWINRPVARGAPALPLSNALKVSDNPRPKRQCENAIGFLYASNNDLQHAQLETLITSSIFTGGNGGGYYILVENLWQAAIVFSVRRLIKPTWLNDRDQFLQPSERLTDEFKSDCLVWMLFNGSNLTAGADGLRWNDRDWSLVNHFIPFTEAEVGAKGRFESDFMVRYIAGMAFSPEARAVLDTSRTLWKRFHATSFPRKIRDEYKLGRPDAGWYQIRRALEAHGDTELTDFDPFKTAYAALTAKLRPSVYALGFLPE
ncbi:hypothetical protein PX554_16735 [Sphingomonas sp. H39-1-10]|uniref:hypothetical protein n=1 Tax=Sphingomonas TaxID=13687 RepID=UPI00088BF7AD|nr:MULTISPECIES: hypothetical protein [Sphingomonas]MDF0489783.1 hypothetical protein [Sphingomonas pollutisoli]SDA31514.1 hypothetical protein SAMN03159340_02645 [Sphingomonas sp. NFR15]